MFEYQERDWVTDTYKSESDLTLFDIDYIHDDVGKIDSLSYSDLSETDNVGYDYDKLSRLTKATSSTNSDYEYAYDDNGNIDWRKIDGDSTDYKYANGKPNRLTDVGSTTYSYDSNGNIGEINEEDPLLHYDYKNQLEWMESADDEFYHYDSNGMRVYKEGFGGGYGENFNDGDFDDGDPTDWYTTGANWEVSSGELFRNSTTTSLHQFSNPDTTFDDFTAEYDLKADDYYATNYWAAFAFRKTNYSDIYTNSGYMVYYRYNGQILLYEAGVGTIASSSTGLDLSTWRHVKIVVAGSSIKVYVDGNLEINKTDGTYTDGYFGFYVSGLKARFDDLTLSDEHKVHYIRDVNGDVIAEYDATGSLMGEYAYANGQRIAKLTAAGNADFYLNDHLGSARAMTRSQWSANYYPFGEKASQTGTNVDTRFDFTGQERDEGTGLMYFGARYYDPVIGRFLSVDPLAGSFPSWSPYNYTLNNPVNLIDPTGLMPEELDELTKEQLLEKIQDAQKSQEDVLTTVIKEIASAGDVRVTGETLRGVLGESGVSLTDEQTSELDKVQDISKEGSKLTMRNSDKITLKGEQGSITLNTKVTANILTSDSEVALKNVKGASAKSGIRGGIKEVKILKDKGVPVAKIKVKIGPFSKTTTIPLQAQEEQK